MRGPAAGLHSSYQLIARVLTLTQKPVASRESLEISRVGGAAERTTHTRTYTRFIGTTYTTIPIYVSTTNGVSPGRREHNDRAHAARARRVHTLRPQAAPALACRKRQMHKHACAPRIFCNNNMASLCTRTCAMLLPPPPRAASDALMYAQSVALGGSRRQPIKCFRRVCVCACVCSYRACVAHQIQLGMRIVGLGARHARDPPFAGRTQSSRECVRLVPAVRFGVHLIRVNVYARMHNSPMCMMRRSERTAAAAHGRRSGRHCAGDSWMRARAKATIGNTHSHSPHRQSDASGEHGRTYAKSARPRRGDTRFKCAAILVDA